MTPEAFAALHPRLFHLTRPEAVEGIRRHGLLPPLALLDLVGADEATRAAVLARRATSIALEHPDHGRAVVSDNGPLDDRKLARVLDDGLTPDDWRRMLAERVFLWVDEAEAMRLAGARLYRDEPRVVLVFRSATLVAAHAARVAVTPFNTGSTLHTPTRRGRWTFAPLPTLDYAAWRRSRPVKALDSIREVTVVGGVPDAADHLLEVRPVAPRRA